jgi:hypothetical protein
MQIVRAATRRAICRGFAVMVAVLLLGCATSETRSAVSASDVPASKYKKIAVFIENLDEVERPAAEQIVSSTLHEMGIDAVSGPAIFDGRSPGLSEAAKASIVQSNFDAVLYLKVAEKGLSEERVENASSDGQTIVYNFGILHLGHNWTDLYDVRPDGSVYQPIMVLKTNVDLQDTKTAKIVWQSETISSGHARLTNMNVLFGQAAKQIADKMRQDQAI